jgi:hypothetical protein
MNELHITRYSEELHDAWNDFVGTSRNGTFLHLREYMDYHADRFADHSLMFYLGARLVALLPAHTDGDALCSHCGLTYGGFLISDRVGASLMLRLFGLLKEYMPTIGAARLVYRTIPHIYHRYPAEEELYALFHSGAQLTDRKVACCLPLGEERLGFSTLRRRKVRRAQRMELAVSEAEDFAAFWPVLTDNLLSRHNARPVHTLAEMELLKRRFPDNIRLYCVVNAAGETIAGTVIYLTGRVAHVQYIGSTAEGRAVGAVDMLFDWIINMHSLNAELLDFGTSMEPEGVLSPGLEFQKEGFGGRAVVYDTYILEV